MDLLDFVQQLAQPGLLNVTCKLKSGGVVRGVYSESTVDGNGVGTITLIGEDESNVVVNTLDIEEAVTTPYDEKSSLN